MGTRTLPRYRLAWRCACDVWTGPIGDWATWQARGRGRWTGSAVWRWGVAFWKRRRRASKRPPKDRTDETPTQDHTYPTDCTASSAALDSHKQADMIVNIIYIVCNASYVTQVPVAQARYQVPCGRARRTAAAINSADSGRCACCAKSMALNPSWLRKVGTAPSSRSNLTAAGVP
jgi:hypothetical protein